VTDELAALAWRLGHPAVARRVVSEPGELAVDGRLVEHCTGLVAGRDRRQERHQRRHIGVGPEEPDGDGLRCI